MATPDSPQVFDDLYANFCNHLRTTGKASSFCQLIKNESSDLDRINTLLDEFPDIIPSLIVSVKEFKGNNCKNSARGKEILELYYINKEKLGESENNLLQLLNSSLAHVQIDKELDFEELESQNIVSFVEILCAESSTITESKPNIENGLLREIYQERANYFYNRGEYEISLLDSLRGIYFGQGGQNSGNLFAFLFIIGASCKNLGHLDVARNILELSIKLLRKSPLDNAAKSLETMKVVKLMKEVQQISKDNGGVKNDLKVNITSFLQPKIRTTPKLFEGSSDILIGVSSTLQLKWQANRGRLILAKKTIPPGSTLIVERPYSWVIHPKESLKFCQVCCYEAKNIYPCKNCSSVVYCSKQCRSDAEGYHRYECQLFSSLTSSEILGDMALLCYRTVSRSDLKVVESHIREYTLLQEKIENSDNTSKEEEKIAQVKFILGLDSEGKLDSSNYTSVFAQTTNSDVRLSGDLLKRSFSAIYLTLCLRFDGYFAGEKLENLEVGNLSEKEKLIASLFLRHLQSASCNAYGINSIEGSDPRRLQIKEIGGATYPIVSTTNHSCNCNVYRYSIGNNCIVRSLREIQAGEEILDSYGPLFASSSNEERIRYLEGQYLFSCQCDPCNEDWPVYSKLPREKICFRCPKCGNEASSSKDKHTCNACSNVFDSKKIMKNVKGSERQFIAAKELLLNPKNDGKSEIDYENAQRAITNYVGTLGRIQKWPCQALVECQEALKLCWNLENRN